MTQATLDGWRSRERLTNAGAVFFEQAVRLSGPAVGLSEAGARELAERYWHEVEALTCRLVRAWERGGGLELRLLGRWTLLSFGRPETRVDGSQASRRYPILGGALARMPGGSIAFVQTVAPELELRTTVDGFLPRLAPRTGRWGWIGALSWEIQRRLHTAISRRYLGKLVEQAPR
jgi:hypothetical protein